MGLLVAGITGGASLVENARLTSLKREVDDYIRDVFTFYARVGRLPGDIDNSGKIGYESGRGPYPENSFPSPYNMANINVASGVFVELYLYGVFSFEPKSNVAAGKGIIGTVAPDTVKTNIADHGGIPFLKTYKDFMVVHGTRDNRSVIDIFTTELRLVANKKILDIVIKTDTKFDDGIYNSGNITALCNNDNSKGYTPTTVTATVCNHIFFYYNVK